MSTGPGIETGRFRTKTLRSNLIDDPGRPVRNRIMADRRVRSYGWGRGTGVPVFRLNDFELTRGLRDLVTGSPRGRGDCRLKGH